MKSKSETSKSALNVWDAWNEMFRKLESGARGNCNIAETFAKIRDLNFDLAKIQRITAARLRAEECIIPGTTETMPMIGLRWIIRNGKNGKASWHIRANESGLTMLMRVKSNELDFSLYDHVASIQYYKNTVALKGTAMYPNNYTGFQRETTSFSIAISPSYLRIKFLNTYIIQPEMRLELPIWPATPFLR